MTGDPGAEAVARKLASWAEYHEANWQLYVQRASELIAAYQNAQTTNEGDA